jgi:DNA-binding LytR/AlgR family response regulator
MRRGFRFWLVYSSAWLPFVASYLTLLVAHLGRSSSEAIRATIFATLPPSLLGIGVIAICGPYRWRREGKLSFFAVHSFLATTYLLLWMAGAKGLAALDQKVEYQLPSNLRIYDASFEVSAITGFLIYATIAGAIYAMQGTEKLRTEEARVAELEDLRARGDNETPGSNDGSGQWITRLFVKNGRGEIVPLRVAEIARFIGADDYVEIFANNAAYLVKLTLNELEKRLDPEHFRRIHRSSIINLDHLISCREVDRRLVVKLSDGSEVSASRSGSQSLRELIV